MIEDDDLLSSCDALHQCCNLLEVDRLELVLIEEVLSGHPSWGVEHLETVLVQGQVMRSSISDGDRDNARVQLLRTVCLVLVLLMLVPFSGEHKWFLSSFKTVISNTGLNVLPR